MQSSAAAADEAAAAAAVVANQPHFSRCLCGDTHLCPLVQPTPLLCESPEPIVPSLVCLMS